MGGVIGFSCLSTLAVKEIEPLVAVLGILGKFGAAGAFDAVYLFATELFPTEIRNLGMGYSSNAARIGVLCVSPLIAVGGALPWLGFGATTALGATIAYVLPETLGQPMWETMAEVREILGESAVAALRAKARAPVGRSNSV